MEPLDDLRKVRRGIVGGLDHSDKDYRQNCNTSEEQDKAYEDSENRMKEFGYSHVAPSLLSLASNRIAASTLPPSWAALFSTCTFSVSSVV